MTNGEFMEKVAKWLAPYLKENCRRKGKMTDEQIEIALNICTFGYLREKPCKKCPLDSNKEPCITNLHLAALEYIIRLKAENSALRERLEKAVELPEPFIERDERSKMYCIYISKVETSCSLTENAFETLEAAEARLTELKGEKK